MKLHSRIYPVLTSRLFLSALVFISTTPMSGSRASARTSVAQEKKQDDQAKPADCNLDELKKSLEALKEREKGFNEAVTKLLKERDKLTELMEKRIKQFRDLLPVEDQSAFDTAVKKYNKAVDAYDVARSNAEAAVADGADPAKANKDAKVQDKKLDMSNALEEMFAPIEEEQKKQDAIDEKAAKEKKANEKEADKKEDDKKEETPAGGEKPAEQPKPQEPTKAQLMNGLKTNLESLNKDYDRVQGLLSNLARKLKEVAKEREKLQNKIRDVEENCPPKQVALSSPGAGPRKTEGEPPEPSTSAEVVNGNIPGYAATVTTPTGLFTTVLTTPSKDKVEIYLPRNLFAGETVRGSMKVTPATPDITSVPLSFQIGIGDYIEVTNGSFTATLDQQPETKMRLMDKRSGLVATVDFHTQKPKQLNEATLSNRGTQLSDFYVSSSGTYGSLLRVITPEMQAEAWKNFRPSGIVFIGSQPMPIIAATTRELITRIDYAIPGLTEIEIKEGIANYRRPFRVLKLELTADRLNLLKGESTTVHIVVHGLENLHVPAHMKIVVSGTVSMTGASEVEIQPSDISAAGTYTTARTLHAVEAGGFGMTVTVTVEREVEVVDHKNGKPERLSLFYNCKDGQLPQSQTRMTISANPHREMVAGCKRLKTHLPI